MRTATPYAPGFRATGRSGAEQSRRCGGYASRALNDERFTSERNEQLFQTVLAVLCGQRPRVAFEQDLAAREEQYAIADVLHLIHVVRGPEHTALAARSELADSGTRL